MYVERGDRLAMKFIKIGSLKWKQFKLNPLLSSNKFLTMGPVLRNNLGWPYMQMES